MTRLAVRGISGHTTMLRRGGIAWYMLPARRWSFLADTTRTATLHREAAGYAALADRRIWRRVTSRPYPASEWARQLDERTPEPLDRAVWRSYLLSEQEHLIGANMADKLVYLGVRFGNAADLRTVDMAVVSLEAVPCTGPEVEWLMHRSVGLLLPAPALSSASGGDWHADDLAAFVDGVTVEPTRFGRTVKLTRVNGKAVTERHVAVLTLGRMDDLDVPEVHDPWMLYTDRLPFPVEWAQTVDVEPGQGTASGIHYQLLKVRDLARSYGQHDIPLPESVNRAMGRASEIEDAMSTGDLVTSTRVNGWHRLAVAGRTEEECLERVQDVRRLYAQINVTVEHPTGMGGATQRDLLAEFIPGEPLASKAYMRRMDAGYFAGSLPQATAAIGDGIGLHLADTCGTATRPVNWDTHHATEVAESSGLVPVVGTQGAGKSTLVGAIAHGAVLRGIPTTILDPTGLLGALCSMPEFADHARHLDVVRAPSGTLNPYRVIPQPGRADHPDPLDYAEAVAEAAAERMELAADILRMLLPAAVDSLPETPLAVTEAVAAVGGGFEHSLLEVIAHLNHMEGHGSVLARYLDAKAALPYSRTFLGGVDMAQPPGESLLVLSMQGMVLPDPGTPRELWTTPEQMAVPMLHLATHYATRRVYGRPRAERKLLALDEASFLGRWASGQNLFNRLARDTRKWNMRVLLCSQDPDDLLGVNIANHISSAFVGRIEDPDVAAAALRMLRVPVGVGYEQTVAGLSPRPAHGRLPYRDFLMRDDSGRVEKVRVDLRRHEGLLDALYTTTDGVVRTPVSA